MNFIFKFLSLLIIEILIIEIFKILEIYFFNWVVLEINVDTSLWLLYLAVVHMESEKVK